MRRRGVVIARTTGHCRPRRHCQLAVMVPFSLNKTVVVAAHNGAFQVFDVYQAA